MVDLFWMYLLSQVARNMKENKKYEMKVSAHSRIQNLQSSDHQISSLKSTSM